MNDKVHVVFTRVDISDEYSRHTAAAMASVLENCSKPVVFHIIHEERVSFVNQEKAEENINKYRELIGRYNAEIFYHNIILPKVYYDPDNVDVQNIPHVILYRFFIQDILPNDVDYTISLGSDVIVNCDLAELMNSVPAEYSLGGVIDQGLSGFSSRPQTKKFYHFLHFQPTTYINIDITIFNLKKLRQTKILPRAALDFIYQHPIIPMWEQDILNYIFQGDIFILKPQYNLIASLGINHIENILSTRDKKGYILHYAGPNKPWEEYNGKYDMEYWYYLSLTPWGKREDFYPLIIKVMISSDAVISDMSRWICHYHSYREILGTLWDLTFPLYKKLIVRYIKYIKRAKHLISQ